MVQGAPDKGVAAVTEGLAPGTLVAERYRIERLLGEGGMGAVYRAQHILMRKAVALKVLHPDAGEFPEVVARFEREAIAAAHMVHPNIVSATDFGKLPDGSFFLVLEYVDGVSLRDMIARGPLSCERALHVVREIASALVVAHESGVVHRDLKPENVMLVEQRGGGLEAVKVFDFGIAKIDVGRVTSKEGSTLQPITRVGTVFGTPDYMAPEQAMGQPVDGRADLYALGVMLFEMLTGSRPYKGGAVTLMRQHILQDAPELPADVAQKIDPAIGDVLKQLLAKDVADRYANAGQMVSAIDAITGRAPSAPPLGRSQSSRPAPSQPAGVTVESTPSRALTPAIIAPSDKSWRPPISRGAYSAEASKRKRRIVGSTAIVVGALVIGGVAGVGLWSMNQGPSRSGTSKPSPGSNANANANASAAASSAIETTTPSDPTTTGANAADPGLAAGAASESAATPASPSAEAAPGPSAAPVTPKPSATPTRENAPSRTTTPTKRDPGSGSGRGRKKTGPGGIYLPPPKDWLK